MANLDSKDIEILKRLQKNSRIRVSDLSAIVNLSQPATTDRIKSLMDAGIIKTYGAILDKEKLGLAVTAIISINLNLSFQHPIDDLKEQISKLDEVLECFNVSGDSDFIIKVVAKDIQAYDLFIREKLGNIKQISKVKSAIVINCTKETMELPLEGL